MQRRTFLTKAALAATATSTALLAACGKKESGTGEAGAPAVSTAKKTAIKWRLQTYAGPALAEHVPCDAQRGHALSPSEIIAQPTWSVTRFNPNSIFKSCSTSS